MLSKKKRRVAKSNASRLSSSAIRPQLLVLVTQGLQNFFALMLGNFPAALFSQVSHDRSLYFFCFVDTRTSMQCITFFCFFKYHSVFFQLSCSKTSVFFQKKEKKTAPDGKKRAGTGKNRLRNIFIRENFFRRTGSEAIIQPVRRQ